MLINAEELIAYLRNEVHTPKAAQVVEKWANRNGFEIRIAQDGTIEIRRDGK